MSVEPSIDYNFWSFHNCISLSINGILERFIPSVSYVRLAISSVRLIFLLRPNRLSRTHDCFSFGSNTPPYYNNIDKHAIKYRGDIIFILFMLCNNRSLVRNYYSDIQNFHICTWPSEVYLFRLEWVLHVCSKSEMPGSTLSC